MKIDKSTNEKITKDNSRNKKVDKTTNKNIIEKSTNKEAIINEIIPDNNKNISHNTLRKRNKLNKYLNII